MMRKTFGYLNKTVATPPLYLIGNLQVQRTTRFAEQALIERVTHQRVLKFVVARFAVRSNQIERLHRRQPLIDFFPILYDRQQVWIKLPSNHGRRLQKRAISWREAIHASS